MNLTPHINLEAQQLIEAVEVALSPTATLIARNQAYSLYEKFKEQSPICAAVGLQLAGSDKSATVRHFGLQLIEHCIKFRWKDLPPQEKLFLKVILLANTFLMIISAEFPITAISMGTLGSRQQHVRGNLYQGRHSQTRS